jgi:hypothetical protein
VKSGRAQLTDNSGHGEVRAMKTRQHLLLIAAICCVSTLAQAQLLPSQEMPARSAPASAPSRNTISATQETGTIIKKDIRWESKIPLNKTYEELTPEQKAELHSQYEAMPEGDEPPFPAEGIKPIFSAIRKAQRLRQAHGNLIMAVTVDPEGNATKVEELGSVYDLQMTQLAQQVLLLTKYKPAVCSGKPCTMKYKFSQQLKPG